MVEVKLKLTSPSTLVAVLYNKSRVPIRVLDAEQIQPSRLILTNAAGRELKPFDERTRRKFDRTVSKSSFEELGPGAELELGEETFARIAPGVYTVRWGPFSFREIAAGVWKARLIFESRIDHAVDDRGKTVVVPNVWKGLAESNTVEVRLD